MTLKEASKSPENAKSPSTTKSYTSITNPPNLVKLNSSTNPLPLSTPPITTLKETLSFQEKLRYPTLKSCINPSILTPPSSISKKSKPKMMATSMSKSSTTTKMSTPLSQEKLRFTMKTTSLSISIYMTQTCNLLLSQMNPHVSSQNTTMTMKAILTFLVLKKYRIPMMKKIQNTKKSNIKILSLRLNRKK